MASNISLLYYLNLINCFRKSVYLNIVLYCIEDKVSPSSNCFYHLSTVPILFSQIR